MRVLVVTNMYPTRAEPWFGSFVKDQVEAIRRLGVFVHVFHFDGRRKRGAYAAAARGVRALAHSGDFDLAHAHYGLTGAVALCQHSLPVVTTFHGSDSAQVAWQRRVSWLVARRTVPIFVAAANANRLGLSHAAVVPAGVDTALFQPQERTAARAELGWSEDAVYVLFPGARSNSIKRVDLFDEVVGRAATRLPDIRGVTLERYSRHDVVRVMNAVDVLVVTSDSEGSPVAVKEALACCTPVVSVRVGDVPDVLEGLPGCYVCARDPAVLADAVVDAHGVRDDALRRRALEFSYDRIARQILDVYEHALRRRRRRRGPGARTAR